MGTTFRPYQPDQVLMLPPDLREWVSEGHLAHHVSDLVDAVDLSAFYAPYRGDGRRNSPYDPRMMVKVLIYAYATGTFSSRKMAKRLEEDVAFRMLAAGNFPKHRTLCEFRKRHLGDFRAVFAEVVLLARALGLAGLGRVSVDGTKVRANASKRKAMSYGRMVKAEPRLEEEIRALEEEIQALVEKAEAVDEAEDERYGEDARGDELPEELKRREDRLAAIREAKARLEAEQRAADDARGRKPGQKRNPKGGRPYKREYGEPDEKAQSNFTDPESRIMKTSSEGFQQSYNAQMVVEGENQLVVGGRGDGQRERPGPADPDGRRGGGDVRRDAGAGAGGRGLLQREGPAGAEGAGHRRVCGSGPGGRDRCGRRCGRASGEGAHGREAGERRGPEAVRTPKVDGGGAGRLGQGGDGISTIQLPGPREGPGRVDPRVPGPQRQAAAHPSGGMSGRPCHPQPGRQSLRGPSGTPKTPAHTRIYTEFANRTTRATRNR